VSLLDVVDLRKSFDSHVAVAGLSFDVREGEVLGLLGPNGAGKTTTMSIIAGLLEPDGGELKYQGQAIRPGADALRRGLGVVPQDLAIYPDLTAVENLTFFGRLYGVTGAKLQNRIDWVLERTALTQQAQRPARTFSGGMKRRLNFAIGLLHEPRLVMLDEPTVGVDPQSRAHLLDCVRELRSDGVSVLYASHYMEEVEAVCDRVAIIDHGQLVASGSLDELLAQVRVSIRLRVSRAEEMTLATLRALPMVTDIETQTNGSADTLLILKTSITSSDRARLGEALQQVLQRLADGQVEVLSVTTQDSNLEQLFLELTGRRLRD